MLLAKQETTTEVVVDKSGGFYLTSETIKEGNSYLVSPCESYKHLHITPSEEGDITATHNHSLYIPYKAQPSKFCASLYWVEEKEGAFQLTPNIIMAGKASFATTDVYEWRGDLDKEGAEITYNREEAEELYQEDGLDFCNPFDGERGNPYETQQVEEWVLSEYGHTQTPLLIQLWFRRYAALESEDAFETWFASEYGEAPWGSEEFVVYNNTLLTWQEREKVSNLLIQE